MKAQIILGLIASSLFSFSVHAQKTSIAITELPAKAQTFLKKHFPNETPGYIMKEKEIFSTEYKVQFPNSTEIEFDSKGDWEEIDGNHNAIPATAIPAKIAAYVKTNYKDATVTKIDKSRWGYEVDLSNGLELEFDSNEKFLRIDQ